MSQVITNAFASYWQACLTDEAPVVLDAFVLANIPDLDPDLPISPDDGLPPAAQIVHRQTVDQRGRINLDAVAYTIVMDTSVGDFEFNAMYLINTEANLVGMLVHKGLETKLKTDATTGQTGNSLVKSMLMEYDRASEATVTTVDASTWQIDYAARLAGMDEDMRRLVLPLYGPAWFEGDGFLVTNNAGVYHVSPGSAAIGGLLAVQPEDEIVTPDVLPMGVWVDVYRTGSLLGAWDNPASLELSDTALADYTDSSGYQHHVAQLATINVDGTVTDLRRKHTHGHFWDEIIDPPVPEDIGALPGTSYLPRPDSLRGDVPTIQNKDMDTCLPGEFGLYETSSCAHSPAGAGNWFYCETKSINADGSLIQLAWPYAGVGVLAWRNWRKSTEDWDSNWREAYDTGNKPTPADIGASPDDHAHNAVDVQAASYRCNFAASLGVVRSISGGTLPSTPGVWAVQGSTWTPATYGSLFVTTNRADESVTPGPGTFIHYIFISHSAARMYAATNVNESFSGWNAIYDTEHKPIPSEIGAAPTTHTHSAAQGNADIIAGSWNAVGATVMARRTGGAACAPGGRVAGSALLISSASASAGGALPGTWQCQGIAVANSGYVEPQVTTWIRVA